MGGRGGKGHGLQLRYRVQRRRPGGRRPGLCDRGTPAAHTDSASSRQVKPSIHLYSLHPGRRMTRTSTGESAQMLPIVTSSNPSDPPPMGFFSTVSAVMLPAMPICFFS